MRNLQHRLTAAAEKVSDSEHGDFGNGDALDEQEGAIGAEEAQRAFGQLNGNAPVTVLISRRFSSAAAVRSEASHHQAAIIMTKAPISAAPLNAPRPTARPMSIMCRFMMG